MNATIDRNQQTNTLDSTSPLGTEEFNFDLWARAVKRQMLASIKKREYKD